MLEVHIEAAYLLTVVQVQLSAVYPHALHDFAESPEARLQTRPIGLGVALSNVCEALHDDRDGTVYTQGGGSVC